MRFPHREAAGEEGGSLRNLWGPISCPRKLSLWIDGEIWRKMPPDSWGVEDGMATPRLHQNRICEGEASEKRRQTRPFVPFTGLCFYGKLPSCEVWGRGRVLITSPLV